MIIIFVYMCVTGAELSFVTGRDVYGRGRHCAQWSARGKGRRPVETARPTVAVENARENISHRRAETDERLTPGWRWFPVLVVTDRPFDAVIVIVINVFRYFFIYECARHSARFQPVLGRNRWSLVCDQDARHVYTNLYRMSHKDTSLVD